VPLVEGARYSQRVPGDPLDLILVALAAVFAVSGYRQGFVVGVLGVIGFLAGAVAGAVVCAGVAQALAHGRSQQAMVAVVVVFLAALAGQLLGSLAGAVLHSHLAWRPATVMDAAGGAAVSVVSVLLIAWLIGSAVASGPFSAAARQVDHSVVLRGVGKVMPGAVQNMFFGFGRILARGPSRQVLGGLGADVALTVPPPDPRVVDAPALARDRHSIVMIEGTSATCRPAEGSGFVFAPHHVLTNAHVIAGMTAELVVMDGHHAPYRARVVYFDPRRDIAVLYVPRLPARPLRFAPSAPWGSDAIVAGYPRGKALTAVPARIGADLAVGIPTFYDAGLVNAHIYPIRANVQPGNSGSPLLAPAGSVYGMVFADALHIKNLGYALTAGEVMPDTQAGATRTTTVSTQRHCG
jgi:S1-C subfamily serine protease